MSVTLVNVAVVICVVAVCAYLVLQLLGRLVIRLEAIERELLLTRLHAPTSLSSAGDPDDPLRSPRSAEDPLSRSRLNRRGLPPGTATPDFRIPRIDAPGDISVSSYRGRTVVLLFLSADCAPCDALFRRLSLLPRERLAGQVAVVAHGSPEAMKAKIVRYALSTPTGVQRAWEVSRLYATFQLPSAVVVDADGLVSSGQVLGTDAIIGRVCDVLSESTALMPMSVG